MTRARDLANIADGTFTATDLDLSGTLTVSGDATFDTNTLFVDVSANAVGIGTTSPSQTLHVVGNSLVSLTNSYHCYTTDYGIGTPDSSGLQVFAAGGDTLRFGHRASGTFTERMRIDSSGNVGIGNTNPSAYGKFVVDGTGNLINANASSGAATFQLYEAGSGRFGIETLNGSAGAKFTTAGTERMRIDSSGRLLVGLTTNATSGPVQAAVIGTGTSFQTNPAVFGAVAGAAGREVPMIYGSDGTNAALISMLSGNMGFFTQSLERMRLTSTGNLLVGYSGDLGAGATQLADRSGRWALTTYCTNPTSGTYYHWNLKAGIHNVGSVLSTTTTTSYNTSSDARLKHDIVDAPDASSLIDAIKVRSFKWNVDNSEQRYGMVAQELLEVAPEAVSQGATEEDMMGVDYSKLVPMLVKEIQSLRARVAQLEGA